MEKADTFGFFFLVEWINHLWSTFENELAESMTYTEFSVHYCAAQDRPILLPHETEEGKFIQVDDNTFVPVVRKDLQIRLEW